MERGDKYKLGFLKLRFLVEKGSKKERIICKIIRAEDKLKHFTLKILCSIGHFKKIVDSTNKIKKVYINGLNFVFSDTLFSSTVDNVVNEMQKDDYKLDTINFKPNDVVIDIGSNTGIVSIYLAKKYPFLKIYSFEPVKRTYENFLKNIELNRISNGIINVENKAVTKDGRNVCMNFDDLNSGGSSIFRNITAEYNKVLDEVPSVTLDDIIKKHNIDTIKLLKIDCEGAEYEIFENTREENLKKVIHLRGEFHETKNQFVGNTAKLTEFCKRYIDDVKVVV